MKLLAIDIGNTRLKWALYSNTQMGQPPMQQGAVFLENIHTLAETDWKKLPTPTHVIGSCVAAPAMQEKVDEQLDLWPEIEPRWVKVKDQQCGVTNGYDFPVRLGVDRWLALIGTRKHLTLQKINAPAIIVMVGTAVTVDALDSQGHFLGGLIMPGHGIMLSALQQGTAGLHVPTGDVVSFPKNTNDALSTGGAYAIVGAIERMVYNLKQHTGQPPKLFLTGGAAWKVAPSLTMPHELIESILFDGLLAIAADTWDI